MNKVLRTLVIIAILAGISTAAVVALNATALSRASKPATIIPSEGFSLDGSGINPGDVVQVTGTPDLLNAVAMENRSDKKILANFVPLKEYGSSFVIRVRTSQLRSEVQTFEGSVQTITELGYDNRLRSVINKPVEFSDADRAELDAETISLFTDQTTNQFPAKTLVVLDGDIPEATAVYASVAFWSVCLTVALATIMRSYVFKGFGKYQGQA